MGRLLQRPAYLVQLCPSVGSLGRRHRLVPRLVFPSPSLRASDDGCSSPPFGNPSPDPCFPLLPSMAGRFGFGPSSTADSMVVVSTPNQELALTNFAYCSAGDLRKFSSPGSRLFLALVGNSVVLTMRYPSLIRFSFFSLSTDLNAGLLKLSVFFYLI